MTTSSIDTVAVCRLHVSSLDCAYQELRALYTAQARVDPYLTSLRAARSYLERYPAPWIPTDEPTIWCVVSKSSFDQRTVASNVLVHTTNRYRCSCVTNPWSDPRRVTCLHREAVTLFLKAKHYESL